MHTWTRWVVLGAGSLGLLLATTGTTFAQEPGVVGQELAVALDTAWLIMSAALVFFMQAGFAMLEAGLTRAKNTVNILLKNLMDFTVAALGFWMVGWGLAYGSSLGGLIGGDQFILSFDPAATGVPVLASWFFQVVFAGTAATIVSGALAERSRFGAYLLFSAAMSVLIYPPVVHWVWSGSGWLNTYSGNTVDSWGFTDFAGSTVVHSVGGWAALMGALIVGPRRGRFAADGRPQPMPGHSLALATLGTFILWFGWYGFNAGSQLALSSQNDATAVALAAATTTLAAAAGALSALGTNWLRTGKTDLGQALNGVLGGLVAITAGCAYVDMAGAAIIGLVAGVLVVLGAAWLEARHIDDPVGAVPVHLFNGIWGTLAVGLFAVLPGNTGTVGLFAGGGAGLLMSQLVGVTAVGLWSVVSAGGVFLLLRRLVGLRVTREEELGGLDQSEHGGAAYPELLGSARVIIPGD